MGRLAPRGERPGSLEETILRRSPPCQAVRVRNSDSTEFECRWPSAARAHIECECGNQGYRFYCARCYGELRGGLLVCYHCLRPVRGFRES